jgi:hypothetical protein
MSDMPWVREIYSIGPTNIFGRTYVESRQVPDDCYWLVRNVTVVGGTVGLANPFDLFLVEDGAAAFDLSPGSDGVGVTPRGCYKVCPASGANSDGGFNFQSAGGRAAVALQFFTSNRLIVPARFRIRVTEMNGGTPASTRSIKLEFLRATLPMGCKVPEGWL